MTLAESFNNVLYYLEIDTAVTTKVFALMAVLTIASLFIFEFYKSLSRRDLMKLNLKKYNTSEHPLYSKFFAMLLYLLEYIIIIPFVVALWFTALSIILLLVAKEQSIVYILWISASMIGAIRILSYFKSEISKDLAKLFPFITLSVLLLAPGDLSLDAMLEKITEIPTLLKNILSFVLAIAFVEIIIRFLFTLYAFWLSEEQENESS